MTTQTDAKRNGAYTRASLRRKTIERVGTDSIELKFLADESDDGQEHTFTVPHPFFFDKETKAALKALEDLDDDDVPEGYDEETDGPFDAEDYRARILLGEEQWAEFVTAGGTGTEIQHLVMDANLETRDRLADGTPTRR